MSSGSYATFIRSANDDEWFKFSDNIVTRESEANAVEGSFGTGARTSAVAYVLVYIKREGRSEIFHQIEDSEVPEHVRDH
jgi:hypothetical protein